jgi:NAD+ synthase (glutamine-hydrolysing)
MKITIAQLDYHIGNFEGNLHKMLDAVQEAKAAGSDLICFSELATTGYPPRDFLEFNDFIRLSDECIEKLCAVSDEIGIIVGAPSRNPDIKGKSLFNSVYLLDKGEIRYIQHKTLLPTYDVFDEYRYFEPAKSWGVAEFKGKRIALTVCEDIWDVGVDDPLYTIIPLDEMMKYRPDFIVNVSASPFNYRQAEMRTHIVRANVSRYGIPMFYINHCGAQTELIFDGGSLVVSPDGLVYEELPYFCEATRHFDLHVVMKGGQQHVQDREKTQLMYDAIVLGIRDYFRKLGFSKAVLGLSGGIDSAVTAVLAAAALGAENVRGLLMPSQFSSGHSVEDAVALAKNLGMPYDIVPIKDVFDAFMIKLEPMFKGVDFNITEENIQARIRGILNMAISNKFGNILLNTTNKSEMAVGYGTLYGDLCGGLSVLGDVYKTEVYALAAYINKDREIIPLNSITKPPSAESILCKYVEKRKGPQEIIDMGYDPALVRRILKLVNINEFKRHQTAPVLRVSSKAFGMGRRMPIVGKYLN